MDDPNAINSLIETADSDPVAGTIHWDPLHSLWNGGMALTAAVLAPLTITPAAVLVFVLSTGAVLLLGHSIGFHRRMIHRSFECPLWLEYVLVWFGTAVGMSGPFWMIRTHDTRDWAQRQPHCHRYLSHASPMAVDAWFQLHCRLELAHPPGFDLGRVGHDRFYRFLEKTWMLQQTPIAVALWCVGGWSFVVWGVCVRVCTCVHGHWLVGHFAHRRGPQHWIVEGSGVQAHDVPWAGLITMGEAWHNNHHAFPGSARIGLYPGQSDWGFAFLRGLEAVGLAWNIRTPQTLPERAALRPLAPLSPAPSSTAR